MSIKAVIGTIHDFARRRGLLTCDLTRRQVNRYERLKMLELRPEARKSAKRCLQYAIRKINRLERQGVEIDLGYGGLAYIEALNRYMTEFWNRVY